MSGEADGLVARIRQLRRALATPDVLDQLASAPPAAPDPQPLADLQARVTHLEQLVQGLQDSVYRESQRQESRITELEAQTDPSTLAAALSRHAREHGL